MKVVFDAYWWVSGPPSLRHVLREIVFAWSQQFPLDELTLVVRSSHQTEAAVDTPPHAAIRTSPLWPQALLAVMAVPAIAADVDADLVLTHNFAASTRSRSLSAVYLHDVLFATNPEWFTFAERQYFSSMLRWIRRADIVFTSSVNESTRIANNARPRAVLPVGLGLSTELIDANAQHDPDPDLTPGSFLLTVGRLNSRKNLATVIAAALQSGRVSPEHPLVIVGSPDGRREPLGSAAEQARTAGSIRFTGFVTEERLRWYYSTTSLFVFLSLGEGFGMPPVEAAHFGAPTLVSDLPVFHENLGQHASYVDPRDVGAIAAAIAGVIDKSESSTPPRAVRTSIAVQHDWRETVRAMRSYAAPRIAMTELAVDR